MKKEKIKLVGSTYFKSPSRNFAFIKKNGETVGRMEYEFKADEDWKKGNKAVKWNKKSDVTLHKLDVDMEHRGKGYGKTGLLKKHQTLKKRGVKRIYLFPSPSLYGQRFVSQAKLYKFYGKLGYRRTKDWKLKENPNKLYGVRHGSKKKGGWSLMKKVLKRK